MSMKEIFPGVWKEGKRLYTENAVPGKKVYGERIIKKHGMEFREWVPERSKLAAALLKNLRTFPFASGSKILYLGASTGTTVSHLSDIVGDGIIYGIEFAERVFRNFLDLSQDRKNIVPLFVDARKSDDYTWLEEMDIVYTDIADPQQTDIAIRNAKEFLKKGGFLFLAVKSQSIDVTKKSEIVYKEEADKVKQADFTVEAVIDLEPYEKNHAMIVARA